MWQALIIGMIIAEVVADIIAKKWSLQGGRMLAAAALLGFIIVNVIWLGVLKNGSGLARGAVIFGVGSAVLATIVGTCFFDETFSRWQFIGTGLGFVSIILLLS